MLPRLRKYREQQAKAVGKETGAAAPTERKRSRAEAIANGIGTWANKLCDLEFPEFSEEDRTMIIESLNFMKETLDEAIPRAVENRKRPM